MRTKESTNILENLMQNPSDIFNIVKNPGKYGLDVYHGLTTKQQQYLLIAAGAGLIAYGIYLGRSKK